MKESFLSNLRLIFTAAILSICAAASGCFHSAKLPPLEEAAGQMLIVGVRGERVNAEIAALLSEVKPGGIILFDYDLPSRGAKPRNISSPAQLKEFTRELQRASAEGLFIAADVEGGKVNRLKKHLGFSVSAPSAKEMGKEGTEAVFSSASKIARELKSLGINFNLAPVADVDINPESPAVGKLGRSFSRDPETVARLAAEFVKAHHRQGVITCLKHFPGHGSATADTHTGVADITNTYDRRAELLPYKRLIDGGYKNPVMTAHVINRNIDDKPATLSRKILTGILRGELGFTGVIVSDDMQMEAVAHRYGLEKAAVMAVSAGADIIVIGNQIGGGYDGDAAGRVRDAIVKAVRDGVITAEDVYDSYRRIMELKKRYGIAPRPRGVLETAPGRVI